MSKGNPIQIDEDELEKAAEAIKTGAPRILRQGIFNPSFYVSIIEDSERIDEYWRKMNAVQDSNKYAEPGQRRKEPEFKQLRDIFADTILRLQSGSKQPQLNSGKK